MATPSWLDKVNFIRRWFSSPCETPWWVYIETGFEAGENAILTLLSFGFDDVVRGFFRPKGLRTGRHGRKRRRGKQAKAAIPEVGETVAQHIPGAKEVKGRKVSDGVKRLWIFDNFTQKIFYHWMMIDVATDFAYDWLSGIMKDPSSKCAVGGRGFADATNVPLNGHDNWIAVPHGILHYTSWPVLMGSQSAQIGDGKFFGIHSAKVFNDQITPANVQLAFVEVINGEWVFSGLSDRKEIGIFEKTDLIAECDFEGPRVVLFLMWSDHFVLFEYTAAMISGGA